MKLIFNVLLLASIVIDIFAIIYFFTIIDEIGVAIYLVIVLILVSMTGFIGLIYFLFRNKRRL